MADYTFKVILVGQSGVGKTAIARRYLRNRYVDEDHATIGVDIGVKVVDIDGIKVKLKIWDSAGSERFRSLATSYYRNADAAVFVYGINDAQSFHDLDSWYREVVGHETCLLKLLVGNKNDVEGERAVSQDMAVNFAVIQDIDLAIECSAKLDDNIRYIFHSVANKLLERTREKEYSSREDYVINNVPTNFDRRIELKPRAKRKSSKCCN